MSRAFLILLSLACLIVLPCASAHGRKPDRDAARQTWEALRTVMSAGQQNRAQSFIGQTIMVEGGRNETKPTVCVDVKGADERWIKIRVLSPASSLRLSREVRKVQQYSAVIVGVGLIGTVRSVDVGKREIVVEPTSIGVTSAI